jgi:hypothetical protein
MIFLSILCIGRLLIFFYKEKKTNMYFCNFLKIKKEKKKKEEATINVLFVSV